MKFSLRKLQNLFTKKDKNYQSKMNHPSIDHEIISSTNDKYIIDDDNHSYINLSSIIIKFILNNVNDKDLDEFKSLLQNYSLNYYQEDNNLYISGSLYQIWLTTPDFKPNQIYSDNIFMPIMNQIYKELDLEGIIHDEINVVNFIDNYQDHKPIRVNLQKYINDLNHFNIKSPVEVLGYDYPVKELRYTKNIKYVCNVWLCIKEELINSFFPVSVFYKVSDEVDYFIVKMSLNTFLIYYNFPETMFDNRYKKAYQTILKIMNADKKYFSHILKFININNDDYSEVDEVISEEEIDDDIEYEEEEEVEELPLEEIFKMYNKD